MYIAITNSININNLNYIKRNFIHVPDRVASFMAFEKENYTIDQKIRVLDIYRQAIIAMPINDSTPDYLPVFTPLLKSDKKLLSVLQGYVPYTLMKFHLLGFEIIPRYALEAEILPVRHICEDIFPASEECSLSSTENEEYEPHAGEEPSGSEAVGGTPSEQKLNKDPTDPQKSDDPKELDGEPSDNNSSYTVSTVGKVAGVKSGFSSRLLPSNFNNSSWGGWK